MGRVYDKVIINGKGLNTIFDPGAISSYIIENAVKRVRLSVSNLKKTYITGLGGKNRRIKKSCFIEGKIKGNSFYIIANLVDYLGEDENGGEIDLLFGASDLQRWNIKLDLEKERIDLSRFRKEFIEFYER